MMISLSWMDIMVFISQTMQSKTKLNEISNVNSELDCTFGNQSGHVIFPTNFKATCSVTIFSV